MSNSGDDEEKQQKLRKLTQKNRFSEHITHPYYPYKLIRLFLEKPWQWMQRIGIYVYIQHTVLCLTYSRRNIFAVDL